MKVWHSLLSLALLVSACQLPAGMGAPDVRRSPAVRTAAAKSPATTAALTAKGAVTAANKTLLVNAIHNALGATRASRLSSTLNETSSVIGNNGGNIISDNGLGLIANNGGGIISDNGLGYAVMQEGRLVSYTSETNDLVYFFSYTRDGMSAKNGTMKIYEKKGYKTLPEAQREQALLDHFVWDDVSLDMGYKGVSGTLAIAFPMRKVTSKRLPFVDGMTTRRIVRLNGLSMDNLVTIGWEYSFALDIALLGGETDKAQFTASAGEKDLIESPTSDGGVQSLPVRLDVTGENATGTYTGNSEYAKHHATFVHTTTKGGAVTRVDFFNPPEGKNRMEVECVDAKLKVVAELDAENGGTGEVLSLAGATPKQVATLKYDAEGIATISFEDGSELKARLF